MTDTTIVAFDLYGTLLSTESIAKQLEKYVGHAKAQSISALWRRYQLEYTWRLNSMGEPTTLVSYAILTACRPL
jgi:2-haloacid dehalogenase